MVRPRRGSDCSISVRRRFLFSLPLLVWRLHIHFSLFTLCFFFFFSFFVSTERYKLLIVLALAARCLVLSRRLTPSSSRDFRLLDDFSASPRDIENWDGINSSGLFFSSLPFWMFRMIWTILKLVYGIGLV